MNVFEVKHGTDTHIVKAPDSWHHSFFHRWANRFFGPFKQNEHIKTRLLSDNDLMDLVVQIQDPYDDGTEGVFEISAYKQAAIISADLQPEIISTTDHSLLD